MHGEEYRNPLLARCISKHVHCLGGNIQWWPKAPCPERSKKMSSEAMSSQGDRANMLLGIRTDCMAWDTSHAALGKPHVDNVLGHLQGLSVSGPEGLISPVLRNDRTSEVSWSDLQHLICQNSQVSSLCFVVFNDWKVSLYHNIYFCFVYVCVCMHIHAHMRVVFTKARRGCWMPWSWRYKLLWAIC